MFVDFTINVIAGVFLSVVAWLIFSVLQPRYLTWRYKQFGFYGMDKRAENIGPRG